MSASLPRARCPMCHGLTLVQSSESVIVDFTAWYATMRQGMALWCTRCMFVAEVPADLQAKVRLYTPEYTPTPEAESGF